MPGSRTPQNKPDHINDKNNTNEGEKKPAGNSEQCDARRSERLQAGQHIVRLMLGTLADDAMCKVNGGDTECPCSFAN